MGEVTSMSQTPIFALDIGTHKIAGLLMMKSNDGYQIEHGVMLEQLPQAMRDGQIHNIASVAKVIRQVKSQLEKASGMTLSEAAVAAAGRSLETRTSEARRVLHPAEPLTEDAVKALELQAVANAMRDLTKPMAKNALESYLCVGCSVVRSYLDGEPIGSLSATGTEAKVEVIATFLPRVVIDSLAICWRWQVWRWPPITLEPIAAMHIASQPPCACSICPRRCWGWHVRHCGGRRRDNHRLRHGGCRRGPHHRAHCTDFLLIFSRLSWPNV